MYTRSQIIESIKSIPNEGGVYFWYVDELGGKKLNIPLEGCTFKDGYYLIYIGLSKDIRMRLKWHTTDKHRPSGIKSGTLSVLRQKLSALLYDNWHSKEQVDTFMDEHMKVEYIIDPEYKQSEIQLIHSHVLPLNVRDNNHPFIKTMRKKNGQAKRNSLKYLATQEA
jgi:hypothetical protein